MESTNTITSAVIKCLIIDDEPLARNVIKKYLDPLDHFEVCGEASNVIEAFELMENLNLDLIFLDVEMPELNGIDFIKTLETKPSIIITTAYRDYAVEGFELNVIDYLIKPIALPRFMNALNRFRKIQNIARGSSAGEEQLSGTLQVCDHIFIKADKRMVKVHFEEILFIESLKDYVRVVTQSEELITHANLSNFMANLPQDNFMRIHKSYAVSKSKIRSLEGNLIEVNGRKLPIGRNYQSEVKRSILNG
ncbi:response regulator transcription factor [Fulvivirga sp. M361]|uniref:LytR/AlgR family response regulator transcription factor n=1 Tax=Fulvivirga sp. M361 TaxID=2594266 RepID=UPI00117BD298|nr:LytTR family DNA-binding domain-containing protein [Fulvivirga sp. M361]TRX60758.1 response regulator transcription factor [Fulvivirga sp. M361]